jgi:pimeloyl-ACP methyl ester carboxylesterase
MIKRIRNGSVEIHAETFGNTRDAPVLLIAGAMAPAVFWETRFCASLADLGYNVIRFDNRDIGKSTHFPQSAPESGIDVPYTIHDMVDDAHGVLENLTDKRCHIIGHSLGGSIAQLFAVTYPEKTITVTAISSPILAKAGIPYIETDPSALGNAEASNLVFSGFDGRKSFSPCMSSMGLPSSYSSRNKSRIPD